MSSSLESLADHPAVVLGAYVCAFLPWSAFSTLDFISARWKTVRQSRHDACYHLVFVLLPMGYISMYIVLQLLASDFKEMAAAIVALLLSLHHVARTLWALYQLVLFRRWAVACIRALRAHGIHYRPKCGGQHMGDDWALADCLKLNDQVVDNQLLHGGPRCTIVPAGGSPPPQTLCNDAAKRSVFSLFFVQIRANVVFMLLVLRVLCRAALKRVGVRLPVDHRQYHIVPYQPIDLWITWASVFVAQGLDHWVLDFQLAKPEQDQHSARDYYASELLASTSLHCAASNSASKCAMRVNPFFLAPEIATSDGRLTKQSLLRTALLQADALPFRAPHRPVNPDGNYGYGLFAIKLQREIESMPAEFGDAILRLDVERLEWLAILLHFGAAHNAEEDQLEDRRTSEESLHHSSGSCEEAEGGTETTADTDSDSSNDAVPKPQPEHNQMIPPDEDEISLQSVRNLVNQLGFDVETPTFDVLPALSSYPLDVKCFDVVSEFNRHVPKAGQYLDAYLSLLAGQDIEFLQQSIKYWRTPFDPSFEPLPFSENASFLKSFASVYEYQYELEKQRLEFQFGQKDTPAFHRDMTVTFMGYSMELVRSAMAAWAQAQQDSNSRDSDVWTSLTLNVRPATVLGSLSNELSKLLRSPGAQDRLSKKWIQSRLLAELQDVCYSSYENRDGLSSVSLLALLVLSFPSLSLRQRTFEELHTVTLKSFVSVRVDRAESNAVHGIEVLITPVAAPDLVFLRVSFPLTEGKESRLLVSVSVGWDLPSGGKGTLNLQWWRDAFCARLQSKADWQSAHKFRSIPCLVTNGAMRSEIASIQCSNTRTGKHFRAWLGWKPFRLSFTKFELETHGFLLQYDDERTFMAGTVSSLDNRTAMLDLPYRELKVVSYSKARSAVLVHALHVVEDTMKYLLNRGNNHITDESREDPLLSIRDELERLKKQAFSDRSRMALLLDMGAVSFLDEFCVKESIRLFSTYPDKKVGVNKSLGLIKRYMAELFRKRRFQAMSLEKQREMTRFLEVVYQNLIEYDSLSVDVLNAYVAYLQLVDSPDFAKIEEIKARLRRMFMLEPDFILVSLLSRLATMKTRCWSYSETEPKPNSLSLRISKTGQTLAWKELSQATMERVLLERVANQSSVPRVKQIALINLAILHGHGKDTWGIKDPNTSLGLLRQACSLGTSVLCYDNMAGVLTEFDETRNPSEAKRFALKALNNGKSPVNSVRLADAILIQDNIRQEDVEHALQIYEQAVVEYGIRRAATKIGKIFLGGEHGIEKDVEKAKEWFEKGARLGDPDSLTILSRYIYASEDMEQIPLVQALESEIVEYQDYNTMNHLALRLTEGMGVEKNESLAVELMECAVEGQDANAMSNLGSWYMSGKHGLTEDKKIAETLFRRALDLQPSLPFLTQKLSLLLEHHPEQYMRRESLRLLEAAVDQGCPLALTRLAALYRKGNEFLKVDEAKAMDLFNVAISQFSELDALFMQEGELTPMSFFDWMAEEGKIAEEQRLFDLFRLETCHASYTICLVTLAQMYDKGADGVPKNEKRCTDLYKKAIKIVRDEGEMGRLGLELINGFRGCPINRKLGLKMVRIAVDSGKCLEELPFLYIDELARGSDGEPAQTEQAARRLEMIIETKPEIRSEALVRKCYLFGYYFGMGLEGFAQDVERGLRLLEVSAGRCGDLNSMLLAAQLYQQKKQCTSADMCRAKYWLQSAIDLHGSSEAMFQLGQMLIVSGDVEDKDKGRELVRRSIDPGGNVLAMQLYGTIICFGIHGEKMDKARAAELFHRVLTSGAPDVLITVTKVFLAVILIQALDGVEQDERRAIELLDEVFRSEDDDGINVKLIRTTAQDFVEGKEVDRDLLTAVRLYEVGLDHGRRWAAQDLCDLILAEVGAGSKRGMNANEVLKELFRNGREWERLECIICVCEKDDQSENALTRLQRIREVRDLFISMEQNEGMDASEGEEEIAC